MTDTLSAPNKASIAQSHIAAVPRSLGHFARLLVVRSVNSLIVWQDRVRQRQALAEMEAFRLDDMGIDPAAARDEAAKPVWRA